MRILYVANHDQDNNDDEGAITHALTSLGHDVQRLSEKKGKMACKVRADLLLFHKWDEAGYYIDLKMPKIFWYFDLVDWPGDESLKSRCNTRKAWMAKTIPHIDLGFCTDGDWVRNDTSGKLVWLTQGADRRFKNPPPQIYKDTQILFTGISKGGGYGRQEWVNKMKLWYGNDFNHIQKGLYGSELADQIDRSKIVVAPDSPITNYYWSNRVYLTLSCGGFLLHPYSEGLAGQFEDGEHLKFYHSMSDLKSLVPFYQKRADLRVDIARKGNSYAMQHQSYHNRCEQLLRIVKERLGVG